MTSQNSVQEVMEQLQQGNGTVVEQLWNEYFERMKETACRNIGPLPGKYEEGEEVALSAFKSFIFRAEKGDFSNLQDRNELWKLLSTITIRKAKNLNKRERCQKRDAARKVSLADLRSPQTDSSFTSKITGQEPDPVREIEVRETFQHLLQMLNEERFHQATIAINKMRGFTNKESAEQLNVSESTIEYQLNLIRKKWIAELERLERPA